MSNEELKDIIKESVREAIKEERLSLYEVLIPTVSKRELDEIIKHYGSPDKYNLEDFVDMTDWIKR